MAAENHHTGAALIASLSLLRGGVPLANGKKYVSEKNVDKAIEIFDGIDASSLSGDGMVIYNQTKQYIQKARSSQNNTESQQAPVRYSKSKEISTGRRVVGFVFIVLGVIIGLIGKAYFK